MQIGAENRNKLIAAVVLMTVAFVLIGNFLFNSGSSTSVPTTSTPAPAAAPQATSRRTASGRKVNAEPRSLDPTLRYDWLKVSEDTKYEGAGRNIFRAEAEIPTPEDNGTTDHQAQAPPQPPPGLPPPPPITLKFFGFATGPGEPKKIFLSQGEDVFIAAEGDIVDRRYRVLHIGPSSVEIEDVLNNNRQSIPLTQG